MHQRLDFCLPVPGRCAMKEVRHGRARLHFVILQEKPAQITGRYPGPDGGKIRRPLGRNHRSVPLLLVAGETVEFTQEKFPCGGLSFRITVQQIKGGNHRFPGNQSVAENRKNRKQQQARRTA
jgi:hypothetical protein